MVLMLASALFSTSGVAISVYGWGGPWTGKISWPVGAVLSLLTKSYAAYATDAQLSDYDSQGMDVPYSPSRMLILSFTSRM